MAKAFLLCGSTGAGKTTRAHRLVREQSAQAFSIDEWMRHLYWKDAPATDVFPWALERVHRCEGLIWLLAERLLKSGVNVVLDLAFSRVEQRQRFYGLLRAGGHEFQLLFLDVPADTRLARVRQRNAQKAETFQFEVTDQMFHFMETQFQAPSEEELRSVGGARIEA
jgi:predicted kinase